jgi:ribosomal protein L34
MSRHLVWDADRKRRFQADWESDLENWAMKEKYGQPAGRIAERLRRQGFVLRLRSQGGRARVIEATI